jgi:phage shock protein C
MKVTDMNNSYTLDRRNGKIMGVCAGLSNRTGMDVTWIRVATVLLTLCALGPVGIVAYLLAGWLAEG